MKSLNFKKILALVLALVFVVSVSACGKVETKEGEIKYEDIVLSFGDNKVDYEEYRYFYLNTKLGMDQGDATYWTNNADMEAQLNESVLYSIAQLYAIEAAAAQNNVVLSDEAKAETQSLIDSYYEMYGDEFDTLLAESYFTLDLFARISNAIALESELYNVVLENGTLVSDEDIKAVLNSDDYIRVMHILYADEETAKGVLEEAKNATDDEFYTLAQSAEDPGMVGNTNGYYFTYGMMVEPFEEASYKLAVGETSDLVKSDYGYHIIRRLEKSEDYINQNFEELSSGIVEAKFYEYIDGFAKTLMETAEFTEIYEKITVESAK